MHVALLYLAAAWITGLLGVSVFLLLRVRSATTRILVLDTLTLILVALLALFSEVTRASFYLDAALAISIVSFVGTLAASRYHSERKPFS